MTTPTLVEHFFRHEYGKLVAILSCRMGVRHLELIEDAVQSAMMTALDTWSRSPLPDNPSAWLFRVAQNNLVSELRQRSRRHRLLEHFVDVDSDISQIDAEIILRHEFSDDLLRILFVCCDDAIPLESQLVFALKTLCGFDIREIALRLFTSEANVYKRFSRARQRLQDIHLHIDELQSDRFRQRLPAVHQILYLLFTEGYLSSHAELAIRLDLCNEAIRLTSILAQHPIGETPETFALLALMHFHRARLSARDDGSGGLLLLGEQDRTKWDESEIREGLIWLAKSAVGNRFSRYHAEAGIAAEHCIAPSFNETRWERVIACYELLEQTSPSALHRLNRAVAIAEWQGPAAGLAVLERFAPPHWLTGSYLWVAVLADLHFRNGEIELARSHRETALKLAPNTAVRNLLTRRFNRYLPNVN